MDFCLYKIKIKEIQLNNIRINNMQPNYKVFKNAFETYELIYV